MAWGGLYLGFAWSEAVHDKRYTRASVSLLSSGWRYRGLSIILDETMGRVLGLGDLC